MPTPLQSNIWSCATLEVGAEAVMYTGLEADVDEIAALEAQLADAEAELA